MRDVITRLLSFGSQNTYYQWKKQKRPIILLLEKYFSKSELEEFLNTGKINKFENLNSYTFSSSISFLIKLELLYTKEFNGYRYFAEFILDYISKTFELRVDEKVYWVEEFELNCFQNSFIKFLFNKYNNYIGEKIGFRNIEDIRYLTTFINAFDEADLLFLNMNIENNFKTLKNFFNSDSEFYSSQKNILLEFEHSLLEFLEEKLNKKGTLEDLILEYKSNCIKDFEESLI